MPSLSSSPSSAPLTSIVSMIAATQIGASRKSPSTPTNTQTPTKKARTCETLHHNTNAHSSTCSNGRLSSPPPLANAFVSTEITVSVSATNLLDNYDILKHIVSFVGKNQYRFVAATNRRWKEIYLDVFPDNKATYLNASTEAHARICWNELRQGGRYRVIRVPPQQEQALSRSAASHGNLPALQYLRGLYCSWDVQTCAAAALHGHLHLLQWCREKGCSWDAKTCADAALNGHLPVLQWCRDNGCRWDARTCANAAMNGHLPVLQWCRENGCPWDARTCANAATKGHLPVLQWCRDNGCPWDENSMCDYAAANGHLNVLQWCRQNDCLWDEYTCAYAAASGHLDVLKWCRENGCPWNEYTCTCAEKNGHEHVLQWCRENGAPEYI